MWFRNEGMVCSSARIWPASGNMCLADRCSGRWDDDSGSAMWAQEKGACVCVVQTKCVYVGCTSDTQI